MRTYNMRTNNMRTYFTKSLNKSLKGSFTVEASVWFPFLLFIILLTIRCSIGLYQEIREEKEQEQLEEIWLVDDFYRFQIVKEVMDDK